MNNEDIEKIVNAIERNNSTAHDKDKYIDWLFKALIALTVWVVLGLKSDVDTLKQNISKISADLGYTQKAASEFTEYAKQPIFKYEDAERFIQPLTGRINQQTIEHNKLELYVERLEKRILKLELKE